MDWGRSNIFDGWRTSFIHFRNNFTKKSRNYRCKIVGIETCYEPQEIVLLVMIRGVKSQHIKYSPRELIVDNNMLLEFSSFDVRAITFYALKQERNLFFARYSIVGQDFLNGKTIFILNQLKDNIEMRKTAQELYSDMKLLDQFSRDDLVNIVSTAIQEQSMDDIKVIESQ